MSCLNVLITGGAGFIGAHLSRHHLLKGDHVIIFDNMSRIGATANLDWLQSIAAGKLTVIEGDVRNAKTVDQVFQNHKMLDRVYHLAGQVAVTCSLTNPTEDFESNALGTFNVLEGVRRFTPGASLVYSSTNKVYGSLEGVIVEEKETRYGLRDHPDGVSEKQPLDFHSPYGCSKGTGDQYVRDYARSFGLRTVVFRQSCIYGTRQFGVEDQGWLAHFCIAAMKNKPITIYGDGKQVRDILWVEDLVLAYDAACLRIDEVKGRIFNIGGGPANTISIWREVEPLLEKITGRKPMVSHQPPRLGDQQIFVSDIREAERSLGWRPEVSFKSGIEMLWEWINANKELFA